METRNWNWEYCVGYLEDCGIAFDSEADLGDLRALAQRYRKLARKAGVLARYEETKAAWLRKPLWRDHEEKQIFDRARAELRAVFTKRLAA